MPSDPRISLGVQVPEVPDFFEGYARAVSLGQMMQQRDEQRQMNAVRMQNEQLEQQQRQREMDADRALGDLLREHTTVDAAGNFKTNNAAVFSGLSGRGYGKQAQAFDTHATAALKASFDRREKEVDLNAKMADRRGSLLRSVPKVEWDKPAAEGQAATAGAALYAALDQGAKEGLFDPAQVQEIKGQKYSRDLEQQLGQLIAQSMTVKEQDDMHRADLREIRAQALADAKLPGDQALSLSRGLGTAAQTVGQVSNQGGWDAWRQTLPAEVQRRIPAMFSETAAQQVQQMGLTPGQRETAGYHQTMTEQGERRLNQAELRLDKDDEQTKNSRAVDVREANRELTKLKQKESELNQVRLRLGKAIAASRRALASDTPDLTDAIYIPPTGAPKPLDSAAMEQNTTAAHLMEDMVARYQAASNQLEGIITDKNELAVTRLGYTPKVSTEAAIAALREGDAKLFGAPKAAPTPPAAPKSAPTPAPAPKKKQFTLGGKTYQEGQTVYDRAGKGYQVVGATPEGKLQTRPL